MGTRESRKSRAGRLHGQEAIRDADARKDPLAEDPEGDNRDMEHFREPDPIDEVPDLGDPAEEDPKEDVDGDEPTNEDPIGDVPTAHLHLSRIPRLKSTLRSATGTCPVDTRRDRGGKART